MAISGRVNNASTAGSTGAQIALKYAATSRLIAYTLKRQLRTVSPFTTGSIGSGARVGSHCRATEASEMNSAREVTRRTSSDSGMFSMIDISESWCDTAWRRDKA